MAATEDATFAGSEGHSLLTRMLRSMVKGSLRLDYSQPSIPSYWIVTLLPCRPPGEAKS